MMSVNHRQPEAVVDCPTRRALVEAFTDPRAAAFESAEIPMLVVDRKGRILLANAAAAQLATADPAQLVGASMRRVLHGTAYVEAVSGDAVTKPPAGLRLSDREGDFAGDDLVQSSRAGSTVRELLWVGPLGDRRRFVWTFTATAPSLQEAIVGFGVDITEQRMNEAAWRQRAQTDPLTGLANRAVIEQVLTDHLDPNRGIGCGLLFCDLDGFKHVNDTHGHATGDQLLIQTARRLCASVRQGDLVARLGGDEFVVLLPAAGIIETRAAATRVERTVARPTLLDVGTVRVGVSVGHRVAEVGEDPHTVLRDADTAMYAVKARRAQRREGLSA
jgi:diguanylate cyclase (GGDEF)-like protein